MTQEEVEHNLKIILTDKNVADIIRKQLKQAKEGLYFHTAQIKFEWCCDKRIKVS